MKKIAMINNLRSLPNWGCRSTGDALEELLSYNSAVTSRDGRETVLNSGWDEYRLSEYRFSSRLPRKVTRAAWKTRKLSPLLYEFINSMDIKLGRRNDFIDQDPNISLGNFNRIKNEYDDLTDLDQHLRASDAVVINGEGTLILATTTMRDALYVLFIIEFCRSIGKPVYLLNAMITPCPYEKPSDKVIQQASDLLRYCTKIVLRESTSYEFVSKIIGESNLSLIPDALFSWGDKFRDAAESVRRNPGICIPFQSTLVAKNLDFSTPYICVSASSSAWRYGAACEKALVEIINQISSCGYPVYLVETCAGDSILHSVSRITGSPMIPQNTPVISGGGILAGAAAYITGRYHPAIMAAAGGVPTIFMSSNSHKTKSVQKLLGYENPVEFPIAPTKSDILQMVETLNQMISDREALSQRIMDYHKQSAKKTEAYRDLIASS